MNPSLENRVSRRPRPLLGLVFIIVGVIFLARNLGYDIDLPYLHNWWALFILIPAVTRLHDAWSRYRSNGEVLDSVVRRALVSGAACVLVAAMFLLELSWHTWWPLFVIFGGVAYLLQGERD